MLHSLIGDTLVAVVLSKAALSYTQKHSAFDGDTRKIPFIRCISV